METTTSSEERRARSSNGRDASGPAAGEHRREAIWKRAYGAKTREDLQRLYADWAATYDEDHEAIGFFGHEATAEVFSRYVTYPEVAPVLDAGAGTGAAGRALAARGYGNLTAVDLSGAMLAQAEKTGAYRELVEADLGLPLDAFPADYFHGAVLVGVFSYGQAPAHTLDEIVRVVRPRGVVAFTMRTDFFEQDAMGVRSRMEALEASGAWELIERTEEAPYLPKKDPDATFRVFCYRVLPTKRPEATEDFARAVRAALSSPGRVKRLDHCHIWNSMGSRLYDRYIERPEYYLVNSEEEILETNARAIAGGAHTVVELGCGSARKIRHLLAAALEDEENRLHYVPVDLSTGALASTSAEVRERFGDRVSIDARQGHFDEVLPTLPTAEGKLIAFFGGSLGNIETLPDTVAFLRSLRDRMGPRDRFVVGVDLHKDEAILRAAYEAGEENRSFFLNLVRRINHALRANLDLNSFEQESTYDRGEDYEGIEDRCVNLKLATTRAQVVHVADLGLDAELQEGDAIQVGCSRKYRLEDVPRLFELAGLSRRRHWLDRRGYFSVHEVVRDDATLD